jgi:hypothetical protein
MHIAEWDTSPVHVVKYVDACTAPRSASDTCRWGATCKLAMEQAQWPRGQAFKSTLFGLGLYMPCHTTTT